MALELVCLLLVDEGIVQAQNGLRFFKPFVPATRSSSPASQSWSTS
jgi:hypothetical protein